jgi:hypothetical protein
MSLKREVGKLEEVDEKHRDLYVERNGKFYLDAEDANDLTSALEKERKARRDAEKAAKDFKDKYGDLDADAAREALALKQELEEKKLKDAGEFDKALEARVSKMREDHKKEREKLEGEVKTKDSRLSELLIDSALRDIALKPEIGVLPKAISTVVKLAKDVWKLDKDGKPVAMSGTEQIYGKDGGPITMAEWVSNLKTDHDYLFGQPSGGGAANTGNTGTGSAGKKRSQMSTKEKSDYIEKHGREAYEKLAF